MEIGPALMAPGLLGRGSRGRGRRVGRANDKLLGRRAGFPSVIDADGKSGSAWRCALSLGTATAAPSACATGTESLTTAGAGVRGART